MTREDYLVKALEWVKKFQATETEYAEFPSVRVSVGLPTRKPFAANGRVIGQVFSSMCSADSTFEIFISPTIENPVDAIATLIHEYCHTLAGIEAGHGPVFAKCARAFGLAGKMTATTLGDAMKEKVEALAGRIGKYPHARLEGMTDGKKKQSTRMIKCECGECGYTVRTTKKWIEVAVPSCPVCEIEMTYDKGNDEEGE